MLLAVVAIAGGQAAQAADAPATTDALVVTAIERAVRRGIGSDAEVSVSNVRVFGRIGATDRVQAVPDPGARVGGAMRFALRVQRREGRSVRIGRAEATVTVRASHPRAARDIARGTVIAQEDIEVVIGPVGRLPLKPLAPVVPGMKALRDIGAGDVLRAKLFTGATLVKAGDEVLTRVVVGGVEVTGRAIAAQSGRLGRVIRVVNPDSGKRLRGRVVGEREIEVFHGS